MTVHVHAFRAGETNYNYILHDSQSRRAIVIDPLDARLVLSEVKRLGVHVKYIINTHDHPDHIEGNEEVAKVCGAAILTPVHDEIAGTSKRLHDGDEVVLDAMRMKVLETPGHTPGHICLVVNDEYLIAGDTLFLGGCGNCKFGGNVDDLYNSLQRLKTLPDSLQILYGHEYGLKNLEFCRLHEPENALIAARIAQVSAALAKNQMPMTTLGEEKTYNVFLRAPKKQFVELRHERNSF